MLFTSSAICHTSNFHQPCVIQDCVSVMVNYFTVKLLCRVQFYFPLDLSSFFEIKYFISIKHTGKMQLFQIRQRQNKRQNIGTYLLNLLYERGGQDPFFLIMIKTHLNHCKECSFRWSIKNFLSLAVHSNKRMLKLLSAFCQYAKIPKWYQIPNEKVPNTNTKKKSFMNC